MMKKNNAAIDRDRIWHPFTQAHDLENKSDPVIVRGKGNFLYDTNGNVYYDAIASWWTSTLGHCNPKIMNGIKKQLNILDHVNFAGFTHPYAMEVAERISEFLPDELQKIFFSDNGSTAVEIAIKMAYQYHINNGDTERDLFIKLENGYHGDTLGAVSVGAVEEYHAAFKSLLFRTLSAAAPVCSRCGRMKQSFTKDATETGCGYECFSGMESILRENNRNIAGVIVEPLVQGAGGMNIYPAEYLVKLRALTEKLGIILIFDEVATGIGRTGAFFAMDRANVVPDIITISKGITGGALPMALTCTKKFIYEGFTGEYSQGKTFLHGHSYTANPLCCAAAIANLKEMKRRNLPFSQAATAEYFHNRLMDFANEDFTGDIRFLGHIGAVDIVKSRKEKTMFDSTKRLGFHIHKEGLQNGVLLRPLGNTVYWFLPFSMSKRDIDEILCRTMKSIRSAVANV